MANLKISEASTKTTIVDTDVIPLVRPGDNTPYKVAIGTIKDYIAADAPYISVREGGADPALADNAEAINNLLINMKNAGDTRRVLFDTEYFIKSTVFLDRAQSMEGYVPTGCGLKANTGFDNTQSSWMLRQIRDGVGKTDDVVSGKDRVYIYNLSLNGNFQEVSGFRAELQQPAHIFNLRVLDVGTTEPYGIGVMVRNTVQSQFTNIQVWNARIGVVLQNVDLTWFFGLDVENIREYAILANDARWIHIAGWHFEGAQNIDTVVWDISGNSHGWSIVNAYNAIANAAGEDHVILHCHDNTSQIKAVSGTFTDIYSDTSPRNVTVYRDTDRGIELNAAEFGGYCTLMLPAHRYANKQPHVYMMGMAGEYSKLGADGVITIDP